MPLEATVQVELELAVDLRSAGLVIGGHLQRPIVLGTLSDRAAAAVLVSRIEQTKQAIRPFKIWFRFYRVACRIREDHKLPSAQPTTSIRKSASCSFRHVGRREPDGLSP